MNGEPACVYWEIKKNSILGDAMVMMGIPKSAWQDKYATASDAMDAVEQILLFIIKNDRPPLNEIHNTFALSYKGQSYPKDIWESALVGLRMKPPRGQKTWHPVLKHGKHQRIH